MSSLYYVVAKADNRGPNETHSSVWPKLVAYSFEAKKILLEEGYGHGLGGGEFDLSSFDPSDWKRIFTETGSQWFSSCISSGVLIGLSDENDFVNLLKKNNCPLEKLTY